MSQLPVERLGAPLSNTCSLLRFAALLPANPGSGWFLPGDVVACRRSKRLALHPSWAKRDAKLQIAERLWGRLGYRFDCCITNQI
jgi:hypothetical protein